MTAASPKSAGKFKLQSARQKIVGGKNTWRTLYVVSNALKTRVDAKICNSQSLLCE